MKFKKASSALKAARALIRSEKRWTQNEFAVTVNPEYGQDDEQVSGCLAGGNRLFMERYLEGEDCAVISAGTNSCLYIPRLSDGPFTLV